MVLATTVSALANITPTEPPVSGEQGNLRESSTGRSFYQLASLSPSILMAAAGGAIGAAPPTATRAARDIERGNLKTALLQFVTELDQPVTTVKENFRVSYRFKHSFGFQFPYRKDNSVPYALTDFFMLKDTRVTLAVKYEDKGDYIERKVIIVFGQPSSLTGGFYGPSIGSLDQDEPWPTKRIDRIVFTERFDKESGQTIPFKKIKADSGRKTLRYSVQIGITIRDDSDGALESCKFEAGVISAFTNIRTKCTKKNLLLLDLTKQLHDIFASFPSLHTKSGSGGLLAEANEFVEGWKGSSLEHPTESLNLAAVLWYVWDHGIGYERPGWAQRIRLMEKGLK